MSSTRHTEANTLFFREYAKVPKNYQKVKSVEPRKYKLSSTLSATQPYMDVSGQFQTPAALPSEKSQPLSTVIETV
jgi:hypothetical protein